MNLKERKMISKTPMNINDSDWNAFIDYAESYYHNLVTIADSAARGDLAKSIALISIMASPIRYLYDDWCKIKEMKLQVDEMLARDEDQDLDQLPWKSFKSKELCKPKEPGWTFKDADGAEKLVNLLDPQGKTWNTIGDMQYRLSGRNLSLIQRRPVKKIQKKALNDDV